MSRYIFRYGLFKDLHKGEAMISLLKKYWLKTLISIVAVLLTSYLSSLVTKNIYKKQIKALDANISEAWEKIGDSKIREEKWMKSSEKNWDLAMEKEAKLRKKDKEMRVKIAEKRALKKQIKEMPASIVVVQTVAILECDEITEQQQGIVFSLICAKKNLTTLVDSFSLKADVEDWRNQYLTSQGEVSDLKNVIIDKDGVIKEVRSQVVGEAEIIKDWTNKFNLSENRGKSKWWRGVKTGAVVGGVIAFFAGFFLAK